MDLFLPELPKVLYVGTTPTSGGRYLSWLRDVCQVEIVSPDMPADFDIQSREADAQLILVDADAPRARDICLTLRQSPRTQHLQVIALGSHTLPGHETAMLENGAIDYIAGPIEQPNFIARIKAHLSYQFGTEVVRALKDCLEEEVARRTQEISATQDAMILALTTLAETRDNSTGNHIQRTQHYVRALARHLCHAPRFATFLTDRNIDLLFKSAPLHDIGKVGIPDRILLKPGRLDAEEFEIMKTHPTLGRQALENAERRLGKQIDFLSIAKEIAYCHHEKWDGSGYPRGLKGEEIPISARLMAVADVYDAIVSRRVYKEEFPHGHAIDIILQGSGAHFDPDVVNAFVRIEDEFRDIAKRFNDADPKSLDVVEVRSNATAEKVTAATETLALWKAPETDPLLDALNSRIDALSDEAAPFAISILTRTTTVPQPLADLIVDRLTYRVPTRLGPIHHALAQMLVAQPSKTEEALNVKSSNLALIRACRSSKAANAALHFIFELPSLLTSSKCAPVPLDKPTHSEPSSSSPPRPS